MEQYTQWKDGLTKTLESVEYQTVPSTSNEAADIDFYAATNRIPTMPIIPKRKKKKSEGVTARPKIKSIIEMNQSTADEQVKF